MAQMKDQNKSPEKEPNGTESANLSDAEFKTPVMRMIIEYSKSVREKMKATLSEIKKNPQRTNSEEKEARVQIDDLEHKEETNIQPEQNEETRIQKNKERIRRLGHLQTYRHPNHRGPRRRRGRAGN